MRGIQSSNLLAVVAITALTLVGCGSSSGSSSSATGTVGPAGATLTAGRAVVSIPPGALAASVQVTVREAEPHHQGGVARIEIEPSGQHLAQPAVVAIQQLDDSNGRVRILDDSGQLMNVEVEDRVRHEYKTTISDLGAVEIEIEHGVACSPACSSSQECDDGVCKPHVEHSGAACASPCASGLECDDGACKSHGSVNSGSGTADAGTAGTTSACGAGCATNLECDNGVCKPHGGSGH